MLLPILVSINAFKCIRSFIEAKLKSGDSLFWKVLTYERGLKWNLN